MADLWDDPSPMTIAARGPAAAVNEAVESPGISI